MELKKPLVVHLCGSTSSEYYEGVSLYYASSCVAVQEKRSRYEHFVLRCHIDGTWSLPESFSEQDLANAPRLPMWEALRDVTLRNPDVMVPHMFCYEGMTNLRGMLSQICPFVGCPVGAMALSTDKWKSRAVVESFGVPVPRGQLLRQGDRPTIPTPFILKPCREDNSMGLSLYRGTSEEDLDKVLARAFEFDTEIVCEQFIPLGRELRVGVLETDQGLQMLPCMEYFLTEDHPIRESADKYVTDSSGVPTTLTSGRRQCPASIDTQLVERLKTLAFLSHTALGCKDYSLFDVRIDPDGKQYFLEACLYCSFAPKSVLVSMTCAAGQHEAEMFESLVDCTIKSKAQNKLSGGSGHHGMRKK